MKGFSVRSAIPATLERVWQASGRNLSKFQVLFGGKSANVKYVPRGKDSEAQISFPDLDEGADVDVGVFNQYVGYSLHQLGHVWWSAQDSGSYILAEKSRAAKMDGKVVAYVQHLVNALEDIRQEDRTIKANYAGNAKVLLEHLINISIANQKTLTDPSDLAFLPVLLCAEGRRLNGYAIESPEVLSACPWRTAVKAAVEASIAAEDNAGVVDAALELWRSIDEDPPELPEDPDQPTEGEPDPENEEEDEDEEEGKGGKGDEHEGKVKEGEPNPDNPLKKQDESAKKGADGKKVGDEGHGHHSGLSKDKKYIPDVIVQHDMDSDLQKVVKKYKPEGHMTLPIRKAAPQVLKFTFK